MAVRTAFSRARLPAAPRIAFSPPPNSSHALRRPFFSLPGGSGSGDPSTQHLSARRVLPYPVDPLYALIADVDSYASFVPYCSHSRVTHWSAPDPDTGHRLPTQADLHVGWGGFHEAFTSRLRCVPGSSVEAVSGDEGQAASDVFKKLVTRWSVRPLSTSGSGDAAAAAAGEEQPKTEVLLAITYEFANPLYAAVSAAVSDKVAGVMIEAFEKRARERLGGQGAL